MRRASVDPGNESTPPIRYRRKVYAYSAAREKQIDDGNFLCGPPVSATQRSASEPPADWYSAEQIEKRDRLGLKDAFLDPSQIIGGSLIGKQFSRLVKMAVWKVVKIARKVINSLEIEPPPNSLQEAILKKHKDHIDRMRIPIERSREQAGIDRREHRERMEKQSGKETMMV